MKRINLIILTLVIIFFAGCNASNPSQPLVGGVTFSDALEHTIHVSDSDRVIAASASFAQLWLLAGGKLVGTTEDTFKANLDLSENVTNIGSLHTPGLETIIALNPQLVILSADISGHTALYDQLTTAGINTAYFSVEIFEDYLSMLKTCTDITGRTDLYEQNGLQIQTQITDIVAKTSGKPAPKVLLLRAGAGKVAARSSNTMAGAMLKDLGCLNIADSETDLLDDLSMEAVIAQDPDFIFVTTMGDSMEKAQKALQDTLLSNPAWANLRAVKSGRYITLQKDLFHLKPNDRWDEAYEKLWELLYGKQ